MSKKHQLILLFLILLLTTGCLLETPVIQVNKISPTPTVLPQDSPLVVQEKSLQDRNATPERTSIIYVVQPGDTLSKIASRYGTTVTELVALNKDRYPSLVTNPSLIRVGWELLVPGNSGAPAPLPSPTPTNTPVPIPTAKTTEFFKPLEAETHIVQLINEARTQAGLSPLLVDAALVEMARQRSKDMIVRNYFSHYDPATGEPLAKKLFEQRGYTRYTAAENIGLLQNDSTFIPPAFTVAARYSAYEVAQKFVKGWLESPKHRENIFRPEFTKTGVGVVISPDGTRVVATQLFLTQ